MGKKVRPTVFFDPVAADAAYRASGGKVYVFEPFPSRTFFIHVDKSINVDDARVWLAYKLGPLLGKGRLFTRKPKRP